MDKIMNKFKDHNMHFSKEELRQKLSWNGKAIDWEKEYSYFFEFNDSSSFGKVATMFTFYGSNSDRPVYKSDPYMNTVNLKMKCGEIMTHFYTLGYEEYKKQEFDINSTISATIIGFDISQFSTKFDFCKTFKINAKEIDQAEESNETNNYYRPFAILLKRSTQTGSSLFLYSQAEQEWNSLEKKETLSGEEMKSQFVKMVWFMNDATLADEEEIEEIEVGEMEV
jgi:hypothetical protein